MTGARRLACGALLAMLFAATPAQGAGSSEFYGINSGSGVFHAAPADRDAHLARMRDTGISIVRIDASWGGAEPSPPEGRSRTHTYRWDGFDAIATALARHRLRWYPMLGYSTSWSGETLGDPFSGPANTSDYASFVAAFARRFGRNGAFWREHPELPYLPTLSYELWNEPNFYRFWSRQSDAPQRYADLYLAARSALRAIDPRADAVVGGLIDDRAEEFVAKMYEHRPDLRGNVDAVGLHPYQQEGGALGPVKRMRAQLDRLGARTTPIELTEIGWFQGLMPEPARARTLRRLTRALRRSDLRVTRIMPYVWMDGEYAIMNRDGSPTPTGAAYAAAIATELGPQRHGLGRPALLSAGELTRAARQAARARR